MTVFLFIRHGETAAVGHTLVGRSAGVPLTAQGRAQAQELVSRLQNRRVDRIVSSPMERTLETAAPLAAAHGLGVETDEDLLEVDFGDWAGRSFEELGEDEQWRRYHEFRSGVRIPGGEMAPEVQTRMVASTDRLRRAHPDEAIAVIGHGDPIRYAVAYYAGVHLELALRLAIDVASISVVAVDDRGARVLCINHAGSLPAY